MPGRLRINSTDSLNGTGGTGVEVPTISIKGFMTEGEARKHHTQYQKMIRKLLDVYTLAHKQPLAKRSGRRKKRAAEG